MNKSLDQLQEEVQQLTLCRDVLVKRTTLQKEVHDLKMEIADNGGDNVENFKRGVEKTLLAIWKAIGFCWCGFFDWMDERFDPHYKYKKH